jgi:signal transduction histidine kinase
VLGLRSALEHFLEYVQQRTPDRTLRVSFGGDLDGLDEEISLAVYRLIQEGLTNVSRHAGAQCVELTVSRTPATKAGEEEVHVRLVDDGCGADPAVKTPGLGLIGMRERVEMLAGELRVRTAPNEGFSIFARLPAKVRATVEVRREDLVCRL